MYKIKTKLKFRPSKWWLGFESKFVNICEWEYWSATVWVQLIPMVAIEIKLLYKWIDSPDN